MTSVLHITHYPVLDTQLEILRLEAKLEASEVQTDTLLDAGRSRQAIRQMWKSFMLRHRIDKLERNLE